MNNEQMVADALEALPTTCHVFHDVRVARTKTRVEHLVVCPGGIVAIEVQHDDPAKHGSGTPALKQSIRKQCEAIKKKSSDISSSLRQPVAPVLCFVESSNSGVIFPFEGVTVCSLGALAGHIVNMAPMLDPDDVEETAAWVAGWTSEAEGAGSRPHRFRRRAVSVVILVLLAAAGFLVSRAIDDNDDDSATLTDVTGITVPTSGDATPDSLTSTAATAETSAAAISSSVTAAAPETTDGPDTTDRERTTNSAATTDAPDSTTAQTTDATDPADSAIPSTAPSGGPTSTSSTDVAPGLPQPPTVTFSCPAPGGGWLARPAATEYLVDDEGYYLWYQLRGQPYAYWGLFKSGLSSPNPLGALLPSERLNVKMDRERQDDPGDAAIQRSFTVPVGAC